jgi:pimeloyl-ACP methyl ester carboxylesterase
MKTLKKLMFVLAGIVILLACSKTDNFLDEGNYNLKCGNVNNDGHHGFDQERWVTMPGTAMNIHYRVIGKGPIDIVFIPGWTNPLEIFTKQFDYFRGKARCIYVDLPGQGLSDAPEGIQYTMGMMADAIYEVVRKEGVKKFVAVGFSMGPVPLGQFYLKHPGMISKLVNLDGSFYPWPLVGDPGREQFIAETDAFCNYIETWGEAEKMEFGSQLISDATPDDLKELVKYFYVFPSWLMANIFRNYTREEVNQPLGWSFPILSIYSVAPADMSVEELFFPNADIKLMEGSGHVVQWEKPDIVNNLIWKFASRREPVYPILKMPFKADFSVWDKSDYSDPGCGDPPVFSLTMEGNGTATQLGMLTTHMTFCCNTETGYYYNTVGSLVAANGDELYVSIPTGYIVPNEESNSDYYQQKFNDEIFFVGGTGRFKGASGSGWTHAYVHNPDPAVMDDVWHTDFFTTGTLIMVKGRPIIH